MDLVVSVKASEHPAAPVNGRMPGPALFLTNQAALGSLESDVGTIVRRTLYPNAGKGSRVIDRARLAWLRVAATGRRLLLVEDRVAEGWERALRDGLPRPSRRQTDLNSNEDGFHKVRVFVDSVLERKTVWSVSVAGPASCAIAGRLRS